MDLHRSNRGSTFLTFVFHLFPLVYPQSEVCQVIIGRFPHQLWVLSIREELVIGKAYFKGVYWPNLKIGNWGVLDLDGRSVINSPYQKAGS